MVTMQGGVFGAVATVDGRSLRCAVSDARRRTCARARGRDRPSRRRSPRACCDRTAAAGGRAARVRSRSRTRAEAIAALGGGRSGAGRWRACRSRSRTTSTSPACRPPPAARRSPTSPAQTRTGRRAAARRRRDPDRQDQPRPVRHRPRRHPLARTARLRTRSTRATSPADRARARRVAVALGLVAVRARHRHRRLAAGCRRRSTASSGSSRRRGLLSTRGVVPACRSLDCVSVFALDVDGARQVLARAAAFDERDPWAREPAVAPPRTGGLRRRDPRGPRRPRRALRRRTGGGPWSTRARSVRWLRSMSRRSWRRRRCCTTAPGWPSARSRSARRWRRRSTAWIRSSPRSSCGGATCPPATRSAPSTAGWRCAAR